MGLGRGGGAGQRDGHVGPALTRWPCLQSTCLLHAPRTQHLIPASLLQTLLVGTTGLSQAARLGPCLLLDASPHSCSFCALCLGPEVQHPGTGPPHPPLVAPSSLLPLLGMFFLTSFSQGLHLPAFYCLAYLLNLNIAFLEKSPLSHNFRSNIYVFTLI